MDVPPRNQRATLIKSEDPIILWVKAATEGDRSFRLDLVTKHPETGARVEIVHFVPKKGPSFENMLEVLVPELYDRGGRLVASNLIGIPFLGTLTIAEDPAPDGGTFPPKNKVTSMAPAPVGTQHLNFGSARPQQRPQQTYAPPQGRPAVPQAPQQPQPPQQRQPVAAPAQGALYDEPPVNAPGEDDDIPF